MKPTDLRAILQYIPRFRDKIFVLSIDGCIVTDENCANLLLDVAVLRSLNIPAVIVHGASAQIKELAKEAKITPSNLDGTGITDDATLKLALTASNRLTHELLEGLSANNLRCATANAITAHPVGILRGIDQLHTGKVERVDIEMFQTLLSQGITPVVPPLGFDRDGKTFRVNSDHVAVATATALKATKIIFITGTDGIFHKGNLIRQILAGDLEKLLARQREDFTPDGVSKAIHAAIACRDGIPRVHVINGRVDEGLLAEVFSNEGIGTLVYANEYQQIRPALKKDIRSILALTKNSVASDELIKRTRVTLEQHLADYYLFEIDKNPVACVALHVFGEHHKGELAHLYVDPAHENQGIGSKMIQFVVNKARELGLKQLITLSTQAFTYFQLKAGFVEGTPHDLPPARRAKYEQSGRKSKVLIKTLS